MSVVMQVVFSLSLSGTLLILTLFLCKPLIQNRVSRRWQYYIWLVVIARLLLPIAPKTSIIGTLFVHMNQTWTEDTKIKHADILIIGKDTVQTTLAKEDTVIQKNNMSKQGSSVSAAKQEKERFLQNLWIPWLAVVLLLLIRKITIYQSFVKYVKTGHKEVSDMAILDRLAQIGTQVGVKRPVELYVNSFISSPLLVGFFRPCVILPTTDVSEADFTYIVLHELTHYKNKDMFYKWLVQLTICLHWFNPLVWMMGREINHACEFSCDEAVI